MDSDSSLGNHKPILVGSYRVAYPILRPGSPVTRPSFFPKLQSYTDTIRDKTEQILDRHQLTDENTTVAVLNRQEFWAPDIGIATLLIINRWKEDSPKTWPPAVKEIVDFVYEYLVGCEETLHVEMTAPQRNNCGSVLLTSGFDRATPEGGRLDWAVIEVDPSRIGENRLPTEEAWEAKHGGLNALCVRTFGGLLQQSLGSFKDNTMAFGASVKCTTEDDGHAAGKPRHYSEELVIVGNDISNQGHSGRFWGPGDSRTVVFDARGQAIGRLFGGQVPAQTAEYELVTLIEDVFEDIKVSSQGQIGNIRIASSPSDCLYR
ncbi:hypothetical protein CEP53_001163 [Fusarium sp. AF-6]|nr:hypothetical protein CEP53_001163 [Fusarium sp. AF-6]